MRIQTVAASLLALGLAACDFGAGEEVLAIDATGTATGAVFLDRDGSGTFTANVDAPVPGARLLLLRGTRDTVASVVTDASGTGTLPAVPVGSYRLVLDRAALGDSVQAAPLTLTDVSVTLRDTARVVIALQYPAATAAGVRGLPLGRAITFEGVVLNSWGTYGDSTIAVADSTGAVRAYLPRSSSLATGDRVRLVGRVGVRNGRPALIDPFVVSLGRAEEPVAVPVTAQRAAGADGGRLDAALVRLDSAQILDSRALPGGDLRLVVGDPSGSVEVLLDRDAGIQYPLPPVPGAIVSVTGVLTEGETGQWQVRPRNTRDFSVRAGRLGIPEIRELPRNRIVTVQGIALNAWSTFGDASLHLTDGNRAIRVVSVIPSFVETGNTVQIVGITDIVDGQAVLTQTGLQQVQAPVILDRTTVAPAPRPVTTLEASTATADDVPGRLDAALVRVSRAVVDTVIVNGGEFQFTVDDGSGPLTVLLDREAGVVAPLSLEMGAVVDVVGLLVPMPGGRSWMLKPRRQADLAVAPK